METSVCPIDRDTCEGANGIIHSGECRQRCKRGYAFAVTILGKKNLGALDHDKEYERHGVYGWAKYHKCKCDECKKAIREYRADARRKKGLPMFKPAEHGGRTMYERHKCRCDVCKAWNIKRNEKERERYNRKKRELSEKVNQ